MSTMPWHLIALLFLLPAVLVTCALVLFPAKSDPADEFYAELQALRRARQR